jgi:DNA-directed RNA polymerase subunit RPC12/RpoP
MDDRSDSQTRSDTDSELTAFFGSAKEAVDRHTHCVLCGANLHFSHQTDFSRNLTQETAKCPECGIRVRSVLHRLQ